MFIISYDISKDKVRNKIAKLMEGYGRRVQYSVFECDLSKKQYTELYGKLAVLMESEEEGNIRIYDICANCSRKLAVIGVRKRMEGEEEVIVI